MKVVGLDVESDTTLGQGGFLVIRRVRLSNRRDDGTSSESYLCDFASRPSGVDAVAVVVWRRDPAGPEVLLRLGLRPALLLGRTGNLPEPEDKAPMALWEVVAGIVESHDKGMEGIRSRALEEVWEEAGYEVGASDIELLGAPFFASPGSMCERVYAAAVEIAAGNEQQPLVGDGSPMEEGAITRWTLLAAAIKECVNGEIQDMKTEVLLRRLADRLAEDR